MTTSEEIRKDLDLARRYVYRFCHGGAERPTLSIPVQESDYDRVFSRIIDFAEKSIHAAESAEKLAGAVGKYRAFIHYAYSGIDVDRDGWRMMRDAIDSGDKALAEYRSQGDILSQSDSRKENGK